MGKIRASQYFKTNTRPLEKLCPEANYSGVPNFYKQTY